ncbi:hypothetical protein [Lewinella sp. JB7]|uniref:hypothetical protein n=1 Tax=Lewinella sp. JB7 TaxID=2962887 RepID=UPI0020C99E5F|nr:hypothetical protein [Lewinella sp. JB7]MCP9234408.1 hypothetical protein [Lewinella sp. JB7]
MRYAPLLLLLLLLGCRGEEVDPRVLVEQRAAEQVAAIRANLLRDCQRNVMDAASARADSLLLDRARRMRRIAGRPPRPGRPGAPPVKELSAPLPLRPLFPFEIRYDTLLRDSLRRDSIRLDSLLQERILRDSLR